MSTQKKVVAVQTIDEGGIYTFAFYASVEKTDDPEFHRLRKSFIDAARALEEYTTRARGTSDGST